MWRPGPSRPSRGARRALLGLVALALVVGVALGVRALGGGGDDGAQRRAVVRDAEAIVRAAAATPQRRGAQLCERLTNGSRQRLEGLTAIASEVPVERRCATAVAFVAWRIRPITAGRLAPSSAWRVDLRGDRATVRRGDSGDLRLRRDAGRWRADLEADPVWAHRALVADACTRAGRTLAFQPLPSPTAAGLRRYLDLRARALEILAKRVERARPPASLVAGDRRIVLETRRAARFFRGAARRAGTGSAPALRVLPIRGGNNTELVSQLPVSVAARLRKVVGPCFVGSSALKDPYAARKVAGRCRAAARRIGGALPIRSASDAAAYFDVAAGAFERVRLSLTDVLASVGQQEVAYALQVRLRGLVRATRRVASAIRSGRGLPPSELVRLQLQADVVDVGVGQLGVLCDGDFGAEDAPVGSLA